ncbi:MAG: hypothetical protein QME64_03955 [bacterium]|nr:hypothetical protein [bacterium]
MVYYNAGANGVDAAGAFDNFLWQRITPPLILAPLGAVNVSVGQTRGFTVSGGTPPYSWGLSTTGIGSINPTAGPSVTFTAENAGAVNLTVTDSDTPTPQQQTANITVVPTSAPLFIDADKVSLYRRELFE